MGSPGKLEGLVLQGSRELQELRAENRALLAEIERLEDAFGEQKVHVVQGYVVLTWPAADGGFLGRCPTLHAVAKRATERDTLEDVGRAMAAVFEAHETMGKPLPPKDVTR
jgi:predicted RNase H-like HicB family nuclease